MATVPVIQLNPGDKLIEDVITPLGGTLFYKGKVVFQREKEILQAFLIPSVSIESKEPKPNDKETLEEAAKEEETKERLSFNREYDQLFALMSNVFRTVSAGGALPVLEIRTQLEKLLAQADQYHILTFVPKNLNVSQYMIHSGILTALTSFTLAKWHGLPQKDWTPVALAGLLHDIGNAKVDEAILYKPSALTVDERTEMRKHTTIGYNILKPIPSLNEGVKLSALQHHEREDGSGYPLGLTTEKIHPYAKIIAITDVYHAMTSPRFYKKETSKYLVLDQLFQESFGKLDPAFVQTFITKVTQLHNGILIRLSDGRIGEIVFTDRSNPTRPMVNVQGTIVNLAMERNLFIQEVINS
ncbi:HD-GYP domain-containing protein [Paenibacillus sp. y28]|uniref:HD-GYP domain-containing protein n=1 Tax=Paenibacillus sp. y28 TaxID=3129110 RepID=UPI00301899C3